MRKQSTKALRLKCAKQAVEAYGKRTTYTATASELGVSKKTLWSWVRQYKNGELTDGGDRQADFSKHEIPKSLIEDMTENFNAVGSVKVEMIDVLLFSETVENSIKVSVEKPDIEDFEDFSLELEKRILEKLEWCFRVKGFKFNG